MNNIQIRVFSCLQFSVWCAMLWSGSFTPDTVITTIQCAGIWISVVIVNTYARVRP